MNKLQKHYCKARQSGETAKSALRTARIQLRWEAAENAGLVRLHWRPDDTCDFDDIFAYDEKDSREFNGGLRGLKAAQKSARSAIDNDGVWGCIGEYRLSASPTKWVHGHPDMPEWQHGDSVWGFVGQDAHCYLVGIKAQTLEALANALRSRCPTCRQVRH